MIKAHERNYVPAATRKKKKGDIPIRTAPTTLSCSETKIVAVFLCNYRLKEHSVEKTANPADENTHRISRRKKRTSPEEVTLAWQS